MSYVVDVLSGRQDIELGRAVRSVLDPLFHLWRREERVEEVYAGFREALSHADPTVRAGGVMFFARMTTRDGDLELLTSALLEHADLYDGVPEPWHGGAADLRSVLASAVASRVTPGHRALAALKAEALEPGRAGWVMGALVGLEPAWVRDHAATIITRSPTALDPVLFHLNLRGIDVTGFLKALRRDVSDDVIRAGVRSALADRAAAVEAAVFGS